MRSIGFASLAALVLLAASAAAAPVDAQREYSTQYTRCLQTGDAAKGVTAAMANCTNVELAVQDRRLNAAYAAAMAARPAAQKDALRNAQRAWIKRRDTECEENLTGGTIDILERGGCRLEMTTVRAVELERMAKGPAAPAKISEARTFAHDDGIVDLLVIGPAAQTLYDRLPGRGTASACGGEGLRKGDGRMICTKASGDYSCHVWLNVPKQTLSDPEGDDC